MNVNAPFKDLISYPSPRSAPLSETNSIDAIPLEASEFFTINAPVVVPVVKRKSPFVAFDIVSPLPKVISLSVTVRSPVTAALPATVKLSATVVSEVECPIVTAIPEVSVATFSAPVAFVI